MIQAKCPVMTSIRPMIRTGVNRGGKSGREKEVRKNKKTFLKRVEKQRDCENSNDKGQFEQ